MATLTTIPPQNSEYARFLITAAAGDSDPSTRYRVSSGATITGDAELASGCVIEGIRTTTVLQVRRDTTGAVNFSDWDDPEGSRNVGLLIAFGTDTPVVYTRTSRGGNFWNFTPDTLSASAANANVVVYTLTVPGGGSSLGLRATAGNSAVTLAWSVPDTGGLTLSPYEIQWRTTNQMFSSSRQQTTTSPSDTVLTLTNGTEYFFQVRAVNSIGAGLWSNEVAATPIQSTAPRRTQITAGGNFVTLVWDTIEGVTAWEVCVDGVWEDTGSLQPTYTVYGLAPNHSYAFRVRALRGTDIGEPTAILTVTTRRIPPADTSPIRGWIIPLLNQSAQTLVVRLGGLDCLLRIKEADGEWFADVEIPQGAPYVVGRRMVTDSPLVDRNAEIVLGGSLVVRRVDAQETADPVGDGPWNVTHLLVFQP